MTKISRNIVALFLAVFFLFAGSGMNIIQYCCDICSDHGIEEVAEKSCNEFHHHKSSCCDSEANHSDSHDDMACSNAEHHPKGCHVLRLHVETPTTVAFNYSEQTIQQLSLLIFCDLFTTQPSVEFLSSKFRQQPPPDLSLPSGRNILSEKSVLII